MEMMQQVKRLVLAVGLAAALGGCGTPSNGDGDTGEEATLACELEGYACSLADVPEDVRDASWSALESAYDALLDGSMSDAVASLDARPDLVDLTYDDRVLRFRLEGGAPTFLYDVTGLSPDVKPSAAATTVAGSRTFGPTEVVGRDRNGDGHVDNRDAKRALFLSPYKWQFGTLDEGDLLASNLASGPPYQDNVDYIENPAKASQNLSLEDWRSWYLYDFIYVASHGARVDVAGTAYVVISSGVRADATEGLPYTGAWRFGMMDRDASQSGRIIEYGLDLDFFRATYGSGLDDTMVVFSACETGAAGANALADAIGGDDFVLLGWSETVYSRDAFPTASAFLENLGKGLRADEAHARLVRDGLTVGDPVPLSDGSPGAPPVFTRYAPSGGDQRLIEVPTLLDETRKRLQDGTDLRDSLDGGAGDGEPDVLTITTRLSGIETGTEDGYQLGFELDDVATPDRYGLGAATRLDDATVELELEVDLGRDAPIDPVDLAAILELPEGGESRYVAEVTLGRACGWTMSFSGPDNSGFYDRSFGTAVFDARTNITLQGAPDEQRLPGIAIQTFDGLPSDLPATLSLGLSGSDVGDPDGGMTVTFDDVVYNSGDGGPCCTLTNPTDTFPQPVVFELTVNEPDRIEGTLTGQVWAFAEGASTTPLRKATLSVEFAVTADAPCVVFDPTDPI